MRFTRYFFLSVTILCFSCKEFLEIEPLGLPTEEQYYNNVNDLQRGVTAIYNLIQQDEFIRSEYLFGETCGDDLVLNNVSLINQKDFLMTFKFTTENSLILSRWQKNYEGIFRANAVIRHGQRIYEDLLVFDQENDPSNDFNIVNTLDKTRELYAQAKFLRAFFYFNLVKTYGGVPIQPVEQYIEGNESNFVQPRASQEEVYAYIERDLREAAITLADGYNNDRSQFKYLGMASNAAAVGYLIRALAYQAEIGVSDPKWQEVIELGNWFTGSQITLGTILKFPENYPDKPWEELQKELLLNRTKNQIANLDSTFTGTQGLNIESVDYDELVSIESEFNQESVFELSFASIVDNRGNNQNVGTSIWNSLIQSGGSSKDETPSFLATALNSNTNKPRWQFAVQSGEIEIEGENFLFWSRSTGAAPFKFWTLPHERPVAAGRSGRNVRFMRYAEILLWQAEAHNELGQSQSAVDIVNKLRNRANRMIDKDLPWLTARIVGTADEQELKPYEQLREDIWEERHAELSLEWDRFWELKRTRKIESQFELFNARHQAANGKNFQPSKHYLFPIPQEEIRLSNGILRQNPGY